MVTSQFQVQDPTKASGTFPLEITIKFQGLAPVYIRLKDATDIGAHTETVMNVPVRILLIYLNRYMMKLVWIGTMIMAPARQVAPLRVSRIESSRATSIKLLKLTFEIKR